MAIQAPARAPRQRVPAPERRAQILDAALRCFARRGYHSATMDDLAKDSGLSKGSLYWYFDSKLDVFLALFDRFTDQILTGWAAIERPGENARTSMREGLETVLEMIGGQRELMFVWAEFLALPEGRARMGEVYRTSRERLEAIVVAGVERGEFRQLNAPATAATLLAAAEGLALQAMVDPTFEIASHLDGLWDLLEGGMSG
jgi:TetR/AcrR family fatty acid metabolism transcriptional regulator